jgi:hypothetical protein
VRAGAGGDEEGAASGAIAESGVGGPGGGGGGGAGVVVPGAGVVPDVVLLRCVKEVVPEVEVVADAGVVPEVEVVPDAEIVVPDAEIVVPDVVPPWLVIMPSAESPNISWLISSESIRLRCRWCMSGGGAPGRAEERRGAAPGVGGATRTAGGPLDNVRA